MASTLRLRLLVVAVAAALLSTLAPVGPTTVEPAAADYGFCGSVTNESIALRLEGVVGTAYVGCPSALKVRFTIWERRWWGWNRLERSYPTGRGWRSITHPGANCGATYRFIAEGFESTDVRTIKVTC